MKKNIDYVDNIKQAFLFVWKYKILLVFGFIFSLFSQNFSYNSSSNNYNNDSSLQTTSNKVSSTANIFYEKFIDFTKTPMFWIIVAVLILILLAWAIFTWYLKSVARVALINAVRHELKGEGDVIGLKSLWSESHSWILNLFVYDLFWFLIYLPLIVFGILGVFASILIGPFGILLFMCFFIVVVFLYAFVVTLLKNSGYRFLILKKTKNPIKAVMMGLNFLRLYFVENLIAFLLWFVVNLVIGIVFLVLTLVIIVPLVIVIFGLILAGQYVMGVLMLIGVVIVFSISNAILSSPFVVAGQHYWVNLTYQLMGDEVLETEEK
ncbi:hypothetical protein JW887_04150 [Candidatus Dojkabacteria bacterium]|nr:hypothetical protein [Candidatus Dojkabacteria bacterium]